MASGKGREWSVFSRPNPLQQVPPAPIWGLRTHPAVCVYLAGSVYDWASPSLPTSWLGPRVLRIWAALACWHFLELPSTLLGFRGSLVPPRGGRQGRSLHCTSLTCPCHCGYDIYPVIHSRAEHSLCARPWCWPLVLAPETKEDSDQMPVLQKPQS